MNVPALARATVALALVGNATLTVVSVALMPDLSGDNASRLEAIAATPGTAAVSATTFVVAQLFLAVGVAGAAHLLRSRVPRLAAAAGVLTLLGAFGHAVYGGVNLAMQAMARDVGSLAAHAAVLEHLEAGLAIPFMAAGLLGTVLGFVVLGVAVWRGRLGPRWLGPAAIAWVPLEFVGSGLSQWAGHASGLLYAVILITLGAVVSRSSIAHWTTAAEVAHPVAERTPA